MKKDIGRIKPVETEDGLIIYFSEDGKNLYFDYPIEDWTGHGRTKDNPKLKKIEQKLKELVDKIPDDIDDED